MFLCSEKNLIRKNYLGVFNGENTYYFSKFNRTKQISIEKTQNMNYQDCWKVSFPLKTSPFNYYVYFSSYNEAKKYLKNIVNTYI